MNWKLYNFLKHYKKITVEGNNPERLINLCLINKLHIKGVELKSDRTVLFYVSYRDLADLKRIAGGRYRVKEDGEYGYSYRFTGFIKKKILLTGILLFAGIIIYQSLFVAEIEVTGYESINEQALRKSMKEIGFYEGCSKKINLEKVKLHLYEDFDNISWIGIKYKGNMAQVTVAETDHIYENKKIDITSPCNVVAAVSGYIKSIDPEEGIRVAEDGEYVEEGDVIISGEVPLTKTDFAEGEAPETVAYVHAAGTVEAKIPVRLNYCIERYELIKKKTGRKMITISINDRTLFRELCPYEFSKTRSVQFLNCIRPVRLKIEVNIVEEVELKLERIPEKEIRNMVLNEIHKFVKEKLPDNAQILNKSLNFTREKNIIYIGVTLETLQEIGIEEEIIVDKSNRQSDQNDD